MISTDGKEVRDGGRFAGTEGRFLMKKRKRSIQEVIGVVLLLAAMIGLFQWYTTKNSVQIEERNKNYASDSARQTMTRINEKMNNALELINTYAHFVDRKSVV